MQDFINLVKQTPGVVRADVSEDGKTLHIINNKNVAMDFHLTDPSSLRVRLAEYNLFVPFDGAAPVAAAPPPSPHADAEPAADPSSPHADKPPKPVPLETLTANAIEKEKKVRELKIKTGKK